MSEETELDLTGIKERLSKATPGPWRWADWQARFGTWEDPENRRVLEKNPKYDFRNSLIIPDKEIDCQTVIDLADRRDTYNEGDLELIEHAPTDIADLVAEVERLRAKIAEDEKRAEMKALEAYADSEMEYYSNKEDEE